MSLEQIRFVFRKDGVSNVEIWDRIIATLRSNNALPKNFYLWDSSKPLPLKKVINLVAKHNRTDFAWDDYEVLGGSLGSWNYRYVIIKSVHSPPPIPWRKWVDCFAGITDFLQAWIVNSEYHDWQNCDNLDRYKNSGKDSSRLRIKHNHKPPPLDNYIIDITKNPGRRTIRNGFVEAVGAEMWFGPAFWERSGASKDDVLAIDWAEVREVGGGVVYIKAAGEPFHDESNADIQHRLRRILFPRTWNIPLNWRKWDEWVPVGLPEKKDADGYYVEAAPTKNPETFPLIIEMSGKKDGKTGLFRLTRINKNKEDSTVTFIPDEPQQ